MLVEIGNFSVNPDDKAFFTRAISPKVYEKSFSIEDRLRVSFDGSSGGKVRLSAVHPVAGAAHYQITPVGLGAAAWYSIEYNISSDLVANLGQIVPCLDASSQQSATIFAVLRLIYKDGKTADASSLQIELQRDRHPQSFPISFGDFPENTHSELDRAVLIFFIEARNIDINIYGLTVQGVKAHDSSFPVSQVEVLRKAGKEKGSAVLHRAITPDTVEPFSGMFTERQQISDGIFLDFEAGKGREVQVGSTHSTVVLDFDRLIEAQWRTLEFSFTGVENTGSIAAFIHVSSKAGGTPCPIGVKILLREYFEDDVWRDTELQDRLTICGEGGNAQAFFDLSPVVTDSRQRHNFGIFVFLPPDTGRLELTGIEAFVVDCLN